MPAYYNSIIKGVSTVMISYSSWNGVKMHSNRAIITGFLKNTLKFRASALLWLITTCVFRTSVLNSITKSKFNRFDSLLQGFVISDWQGIDRMTTPAHANYTWSILTGVNAGIDMVCYEALKQTALLWNFEFYIWFRKFLMKKLLWSYLQIMVPYNYTEFIDGLTFLAKNNFVSMRRIDDAVKRILRVKFVMGLFEHPLADYSMSKYLGSKVSPWLII